jgi:hypothetical protein
MVYTASGDSYNGFGSVAQDCSNAAVESPTVLLLTSEAERLFGGQGSETPTLDSLPKRLQTA